MRFLVDGQLPPALARLLSGRGHVAEHVNDIGAGDAPDRDLWRYALDHQAVIVTKDEDFAAQTRLALHIESCGVPSRSVALAPGSAAPQRAPTATLVR